MKDAESDLKTNHFSISELESMEFASDETIQVIKSELDTALNNFSETGKNADYLVELTTKLNNRITVFKSEFKLRISKHLTKVEAEEILEGYKITLEKMTTDNNEQNMTDLMTDVLENLNQFQVLN